MASHSNRTRFIPFRKAELVDILCAEEALTPENAQRFRRFCTILESIYHFEFHKKLETLKDSFAPFDPDRDTKSLRQLSPEEREACENQLRDKLHEILADANFEKIESKDLDYAMQEESLFHISLKVDMEDFEEYALYWRGSTTQKVTLKDWLLRKKEIDVPSFERVALFIKFKDAAYFAHKKRKHLAFEPGTMLLKLFRGIPKADLEMLFPNAEVGMTNKDKLFLAVPGLAGGVGVFAKAGASIFAAAGIIALLISSLWSNHEPKYPSAAEMATIVGALIALGTLGAYLFRQWNNYKNRKISFMKVLTENLYFRNLDNNAGVFHHLIDSAEEEECKEAMLGYYFMLLSEKPCTAEELDDRVEEWFEKKHSTLIDFEIKDALRKLKSLSLCEEQKNGEEVVFSAFPLDEACRRLDYAWDHYFEYNT